jgi:protein-L-isoaspartate(D-aspartate) O-methyltransferase
MAMDLTEARERMVVEQLERRGIKDAHVLAAMRSVARDRFIPPEYADHAYDDGPLPIGSSQTISQPYMVALMSEVAALAGGERVLEVGTGSGYQAAVLARLAREVYSVEYIEGLQDRARVILNASHERVLQVRRRFRGMAGDGAVRRDTGDGGDARNSAPLAPPPSTASRARLNPKSDDLKRLRHDIDKELLSLAVS